MDIRLEMTCRACPEQYDAFVGDKQVGYLRLRHGHFSVEFPDCGGEILYEASTIGDGIFDDSERDNHIQRAKDAIAAKLGYPTRGIQRMGNERTAEQQARDLLEQCGVEDAQSFSAGDVVALANLISELSGLRAAVQRVRDVVSKDAFRESDWGTSSVAVDEILAALDPGSRRG